MVDDPSAIMSTFTFAPQQFPQQQRETQRNYVFVDEHNRHKRLKVMRACEGCRRRKIKCDAATTNTWPCSACIKLKSVCVRPNGFDSSAESTTPTTQERPQQPQHYFPAGTVQDGFAQPATLNSTPKNGSLYQQPGFTQSETNLYPYHDLSSQHNLHYTTVPAMDDSYVTDSVFTPTGRHGSHSASSPTAYSTADSQAADLSNLLGSLKVNEAGTAPYLRNKASFRHEEEPVAVEENDDEFDMVKFAAAVKGKIRIPPALMPDEETALNYFDLYFSQVHPWVPVLNKQAFYHQWNTNRDSISPLILEGLFAIGGKLADEPAQGQQWLALAASHADSFMDTPRLSTLQAMLILIKAREATPKKGYFYRSWMAVVQCVQMGKDLELDEHYADHKAGMRCDSSPLDCQMKMRIWQTIFNLEVMIGSPQGRQDLQVHVDEVDFSIPRPIPGTDDEEYQVTRNWVYFSRLIKCVSVLNSLYAKIKRKPEWGLDPSVTNLNPSLTAWLTELPSDLAVTYPPDNSPPWLASPFIGNLHCYHYLVYVILHRPQLAFCDPNSTDGKWKNHMTICYSSARLLCRLQEAIYNTFGLSGLASMQRGLSFHVYCALSCIVLHLVAMTSPDPELNNHSREFFTRHMRLLETIMAAWPMPEMQRQVDAVREAFSADTRKPFALRPSFPYGSPSLSNAATPPRSSPGYNALGGHHDSNAMVSQLAFSSQPITPPVSAGPIDGKNASPMMMFSAGPNVSMPPAMSIPDAPAWNPARIFEQWNTSFGTPQVQSNPSPQSQVSTGLSVSSSGPEVQQAIDELTAVSDPLSGNRQQLLAGQPRQQPRQQQQQQQQQFAPSIPFITPAMWQESVASVFESGGLKRSWDYDGTPSSKR